MVLLGLGSNVGDRKNHISRAVCMIEAMPGTRQIKISSLYETEPYGLKNQPAFLNAVLWIETVMGPEALLSACLEIENQLGRKRSFHWGPRTIDIDLLVYDDCEIATDRLQLPHPYLTQRRFVLVPMAEITEDLPIIGGQSARDFVLQCPDQGKVNRYRRI